MTTKKMYCLFDKYGKAHSEYLSHTRKGVEEIINKTWLLPKTWREWYRAGWRIKKVNVTIELR